MIFKPVRGGIQKGSRIGRNIDGQRLLLGPFLRATAATAQVTLERVRSEHGRVILSAEVTLEPVGDGYQNGPIHRQKNALEPARGDYKNADRYIRRIPP